MQSFDNYMKNITGVGLGHFIPSRGADGGRPPPWEWAHLSVAPDQGPDGMCGLNWYIHDQKANCSIEWDHSHGLWNDWKKALKSSNLWYRKQIMVVLWNIRHGPWANQMWEKKLRGAMDEYFVAADPRTCPLWQWLLPRLLNDRGWGRGSASRASRS